MKWKRNKNFDKWITTLSEWKAKVRRSSRCFWPSEDSSFTTFGSCYKSHAARQLLPLTVCCCYWLRVAPRLEGALTSVPIPHPWDSSSAQLNSANAILATQNLRKGKVYWEIGSLRTYYLRFSAFTTMPPLVMNHDWLAVCIASKKTSKADFTTKSFSYIPYVCHY